jgi:hypothetical protein
VGGVIYSRPHGSLYISFVCYILAGKATSSSLLDLVLPEIKFPFLFLLTEVVIILYLGCGLSSLFC